MYLFISDRLAALIQQAYHEVFDAIATFLAAEYIHSYALAGAKFYCFVSEAHVRRCLPCTTTGSVFLAIE